MAVLCKTTIKKDVRKKHSRPSVVDDLKGTPTFDKEPGRSTKSYEERLLQLEKREQESLEKAKQYAAQKRELEKRKKAEESKKRTHRLCQIGGAVESVLGCPIEEEDLPKLIGFLKRQETNGKFFSKAMQKEPLTDMEEV